MTEPTLTVDLGALRHNLQVLRARLRPGVRLLAAVKADAYGHGARVLVPALERVGVDAFGVANATEALALRDWGVTAPILVFAPVRERVAELVEAGVALTVADTSSVEAIERAGAQGPAQVHLKIDTGMGRIGEAPEAAVGLARRIARSPRLELAALWTHLACADEPDAYDPQGLTARQLARVEGAVAALRSHGLAPPIVHAANSAATLALPRSHYDLVRPGIALYGHHATPAAGALLPPDVPSLRPVATLRAPVTFVKRVSRGTPVSYGATWRAPRDTVIATLRLGYADGYPRAAGNQAEALVHGVRVPVVGRVCMDQLMLDVGALGSNVAVGDEATLFGPEGPCLGALAARLGTISYELLTHLQAPRLARSYVDTSTQSR